MHNGEYAAHFVAGMQEGEDPSRIQASATYNLDGRAQPKHQPWWDEEGTAVRKAKKPRTK